MTDGAVKRLREAPATIDAFNAIVDARGQEKSDDRCLWYQDEARDWITIADDDDLQLAYECAIAHFNS